MAAVEHAQEIQTETIVAQGLKHGMTIAAAQHNGATGTATLIGIQGRPAATRNAAAEAAIHVLLITPAAALKEPVQAAAKHTMITAITRLPSAT